MVHLPSSLPAIWWQKCQPDPYSDLKKVSIFYINTQLTFCQMASQPAAIGQPTSHLTKCQPKPNSAPGEGSYQHFDRRLVSQPAAIGQPTSHLTKCQTDPKSNLQGVSIFYISTQLIFCQMARQLQLANHPATRQNVNLTLTQILGGPSAMPCHFTHYIFQAFPDKKYVKKYQY